jgi:hypothetical protein
VEIWPLSSRWAAFSSEAARDHKRYLLAISSEYACSVRHDFDGVSFLISAVLKGCPKQHSVMPITRWAARPIYCPISKTGVEQGYGHMRTWHWLEYDLVALAVLVIGMGIVELVAFSIG